MGRGKLKDDLRDLVHELEGFVLEIPDFNGRIKAIREKLEAVDEPLFIALIGGTGVGKSALINALAGKAISPSSVKRAFTHHKVFFCHQRRVDQMIRYKFFGKSSDEIFGHKESSLEDVVLVDLPDIDSDEPSHPQQVDQMIPHADISVWLVDHEKYNDQALHEKYLSALANYRKSFIFVFNRVDELIENKPNREQARQHVEKIIEHFLEVLKEEGYPDIPQNRIFRISAKRALESKQDKTENFSENEFNQLEKLIWDQVALKQMGQMKFLEDIHSLILDLKTLLQVDQGLEIVGKCQHLLVTVRQDPLTGLNKIIEDRITNPLFTREFRKNLEVAFLNRVDLLVGGLLGFMISFPFRLFSPFYILRQITTDFKGYLRELTGALSGQNQEKNLEDLYASLDKWEAFIDLNAVYHRLHILLWDIRKEWEQRSRGEEQSAPLLSNRPAPQPFNSLTPLLSLTRDQLRQLLEVEKERLKTYLKEDYAQLSNWEKWRFRQHLVPLVATTAAVGLPALSYLSQVSLSEIRLDEVFLRIQSMIFSLLTIPLFSYFMEGLIIKRQIRQTARRRQDKLKEQIQKDILKTLEDHILQPVEAQLTKYETALQQLDTLEKNFQELQSGISR